MQVEPAALQHAALQHPRVIELLAGAAPRKIIVVPGRLAASSSSSRRTSGKCVSQTDRLGGIPWRPLTSPGRAGDPRPASEHRCREPGTADLAAQRAAQQSDLDRGSHQI
jgi:hypothetical protein